MASLLARARSKSASVLQACTCLQFAPKPSAGQCPEKKTDAASQHEEGREALTCRVFQAGRSPAVYSTLTAPSVSVVALALCVCVCVCVCVCARARTGVSQTDKMSFLSSATHHPRASPCLRSPRTALPVLPARSRQVCQVE